MQKYLVLLLLSSFVLMGNTLFNVQLEEAIKLPDFDLVQGADEKIFDLPALPAKKGLIPVLKCNMFTAAPRPAGCNEFPELSINEMPLTRYARENERLLNREPAFHLKAYPGRSFSVFSGARMVMIFAPDAKSANGSVEEGNGADFLMRIDDVVRGVDGNSLRFFNARANAGKLCVRNLEIGYLKQELLPPPVSRIPKRGSIKDSFKVGNLVLKQGSAGGFALLDSRSGLELRVETALGMKSAVEAQFKAEDGDAGAEVSKSPYGIDISGTFGQFKLNRHLSIEGDVLCWRERWENIGKEDMGLPFRHRFFLPSPKTRFHLGGNPDAETVVSEAANPSIFVASMEKQGCGFGIVAENDWLRLLMGLNASGGVAEIYSDQLALEPGKSITFQLRILPQSSGEGYWGFINQLRQMWGLNGPVMERPFFWATNIHAAQGATFQEKIKNSYAHLGPIYVALPPWITSLDRNAIMSGYYPKLKAGQEPAPGNCPEFDVNGFLTFKHQDRYWAQYQKDIGNITANAPNTEVVLMTHPAMYSVYRPLAHLWPRADSVILTAEGKPFESMYYSRAWLHKMCDKDFGIYYYVPRVGNTHYRMKMEEMERVFRETSAVGLYSDEFCWCFSQRGYSRYDYGHRDDYSADLNEDGTVRRRKCDNGFATIPFQLDYLARIHGKGKFFMGNGAAGVEGVMKSPYMRFCEGGNGVGMMSNAHLNPVPMILGNYGDHSTLSGVLKAVRTALSVGCAFSPDGTVNLLLPDADNFICKQYPLSIRKIYSGVIYGEQRLITSKSGKYDVGRKGTFKLFLYGKDGLRIKDQDTLQCTDGIIEVNVPNEGLAIVEWG
ncbi:MAG: hypothetical protein J5746_06075, partial [Victivallales bacterium]|nr:hypothetical protein [Victivallales bacterium]